mmetsp:Transcript_23688/g.27237  ORF Transcript_23688/g.27237 Transcript_23688/m.27237 type:complete len:83 (-) Transcript_23688:535-783(-)
MKPNSAILRSKEQISTEYGFFFISDLIENMNVASDPLMLQTLWDLVSMKWDKVREVLKRWYVLSKHMINRNKSFILYSTIVL